MKVSRRWLEELLGTRLDPAQTRDRLVMLSAPVDATEELHGNLRDIVVGLVLEASRHPNADRLTVCRVDDGDGAPKSVVCGAPNVVAGRRYPFARVGVTLPGGIVLERRRIRGETSEGMLCSARELGLGEEHEGILELDTDAAPGTPLLSVLDVSDTRYDLDVGANRPDLLSHEGVARDLGAALDRPVKLPSFHGAPEPPRVARAQGARGSCDGVTITIDDVEGCPRYCAAVIRGVKVGPSPKWLRDRLAAVGSRPINNVVDATNYLMLENGQPLHAFDLSKLAGPAIVVRQSRDGETLTTLDGTERTLFPDMTLICDAERAVAIAGVMGGRDSEVSASTTEILLECAYFEPRQIRRTRKRLGMSTDASYRFERGVDWDATPARLARAAQLIAAVAGGRVTGAIDVYPSPAPPRTIFLRDARVTQVLGVEVPRAEVERVLTAIGCVVGPREDRYAVQVPAWRPDLTREIDLVEEVARLVGYDRLPEEVRPYRPGTVPDSIEETLNDRLRNALTALGLHEAATLPLGPRTHDDQIGVLNPLSQEEAWLRRDLLGGLVRRVEYNWRHMVRDVRLFEIGHVFGREGGHSETAGGRTYSLPFEEPRVAAVLTGARRPPHWGESSPPDFDLFDLKGVLETVARLLDPQARVVPEPDGLAVVSGADRIGWARELPADRPAWAAPVFGLEFRLRPGVTTTPKLRPLPSWPAIQRDVALVLPQHVSAAEVEATLRQGAGKLCEGCRPFDEYRGRGLPEGSRSVAFRLVFRAPDRTLREEEADKALEKAVRLVEQKHGVRRREA